MKSLSYSALRDSEARSTVNFFQELSMKVLKCIGILTSHNVLDTTTVFDVKSKMGINYNALANIISDLESKKYITLSIGDMGTEDVGPESLLIKLTQDGLHEILKGTK